MSARRPPVLALWLLDRLGFAGGNAPLVGDLLEDFRNGRSSLWFWRQTLNVIVNRVARRVALLQIYWIAVIAGFVAQLPVSLLLFRLGVPAPVPGLGLKIVAGLLMIICQTLLPLLGRRAFGKNSKSLKLVLTSPGASSETRPGLIYATAFESFASILLLYAVCCVVCPAAPFSSFGEVAGWELVWLGSGEITSEVLWLVHGVAQSDRKLREQSREMEEERQWEARVWSPLDELEVSLLCLDGSTVHIEPKTCIETIFASANEELIGPLLGGGISAERIRRAIWLASAADLSWPKPDPISKFAPVPVAKFACLLGPGTESERMARYLEIAKPDSFVRRLRRRYLSARTPGDDSGVLGLT